jgi:hypothetical protein
MATTYSRPGVFVNQSLTPLSTSPGGASGGAVAVFAAPYNIGPVKPTLVTSWQQYVALFGGFSVANGNPLAYAVWQYFNNGGTGCYVIRVPNSNAALASGSIDSVSASVVNPTAAPTVTTAATGGTVAAGTYLVETSYINANGETLPSPAATIVTTGSTSTITVTSPPAAQGATGWYAYVSQVGGTTLTRQQAAGSATAIGTALTITAPPTSTGLAPQTSNGTATASPVLTLTSLAPGAYANSLYYEVVPAGTGSDNTATFTLNIYQGGTAQGNLVEAWPGVSMNPSSGRYLLSLVNSSQGGSNYVSASIGYTGAYATGGSCDPVGNAGEPLPLSSGADGTTAPSDANLATAIAGIPNGAQVTYSGTGWASVPLTTVPQNQVFNLNMPGADIGLVNTMISWAQSQGNVFVIIDGAFVGPQASSTSIANSYASLVTGGAGAALTPSPNAVVYGPWLSIPDPASTSPTATKWVAPGGAVLGYWAQNDAQSNVAQTPAGVQATLQAVALETYFSPSDLTALENVQVNPIKLIPNTGFCIFGGRTQGVGYPNRYINVSRTLAQFQVDFQSITAYAIFQNNDSGLWSSIAGTLTAYLNQAMQNGMLASATASSAFLVTCDDTINTAATAQAGIVNAQVAVALVSPAEFIIINLSQMSSGSSASVSS